jgi:hypothetical protein
MRKFLFSIFVTGAMALVPPGRKRPDPGYHSVKSPEERMA